MNSIEGDVKFKLSPPELKVHNMYSGADNKLWVKFNKNNLKRNGN